MNENDRDDIIPVNIEEEMKKAYIDYSMSVIISRALPDVRDGMKPVHRRVLFGMGELGISSNKSHKKSARVVGEVLGKYHPHGDSSVYMTLVRMAQNWSLRYPLIDGQGNFGSVDGDSPAAMRYTEARLKKIAEETLIDIDKNTVDMTPNFDESLNEPTVLPTRIPNLLINGTSGIAVGMATNMPPHNLSDTIDTIITYIDNNDIEIEELISIIKAPDFPAGGIIYGYDGVQNAYLTGRGRVVVRGKTEIEEKSSGREVIVVNEIPYLVNKAELVKKIAELANEKKIQGIAYVNDESDRQGMRIVIVLKKDASSSVVLNKLYNYTALQSTFSVNNIALVKGRPKLLNLKQLIHYFVEHRHEVVVRRTKFNLKQAEDKAHIIKGLIIALEHLDEVIELIKKSATPEEAKSQLVERYELDNIQAKAILEMRLQRLTGLEREKIEKEYQEILALIEYLNKILDDKSLRMQIIKDELNDIKKRYGDVRRTAIIYASKDMNPKDFYPDDEVIITISSKGYIKRTSLIEFKTQRRGGVGVRGSSTREEDFLEYMFNATMHNYILFFTKKGKCYWLHVFELPEGTKQSKGRAIQNVLQLEKGDIVKAFINVRSLSNTEFINEHNIILCTKKGIVKKTTLEAYSRPRKNGVIAITIREDDELLEAKMTNGQKEIVLALRSGKAIRFLEKHVRQTGRGAQGVKGITLANAADEVVGMICVDDSIDKNILVVSEKGYGKRSEVSSYRLTNRSGKGVKTINITKKTGELIALKAVSNDNDLMIITTAGLTIRMPVNTIRTMGRATQGVKLINLKGRDNIAAITVVSASTNETNSEKEEK